jgi:hypothetical protein
VARIQEIVIIDRRYTARVFDKFAQAILGLWTPQSPS